MADPTIRIVIDTSQAVAALNQAGIAVANFDNDLEKSQGAIRNFEQGVSSFRRAVLGVQAIIGGFGFSRLIKDLIDTNVAFERVRLSMITGSNSAQAAAADFAYVREEATKLGLPLQTVGLEYARMAAAAKGTALQGQPVRDVFDSVSKSSVALGLNAQTTAHIFLALTQMLSMGTVHAQEARIQFGQNLPGGFNILAEAAGYATNRVGQFTKAMQNGQISAQQVLTNLPAVLDKHFGAAFQAAIEQSPQLAIGRFRSLIQNLVYELGQDGGFMRQFAGMLKDMTDILARPDAQEAVHQLSVGLGELMGVVRQVVDFVVQHIRVFGGAFIGFFAGTGILAIKGFIGWLLKLAEVETVADVLASPWLLLAGAIGLATFALVSFGGELVTISGHTARFIDWVTSGLNVIGNVATKIGQQIVTALEHIPGVKGLFDGIAAAADELVKSLKNKLDFGTMFKNIGNAFSVHFDNSAFEPVLQFFYELRDVAGNVFTFLKGVAQGISLAFNQAIGGLTPVVIPLVQLFQRIGVAVAGFMDAALQGIIRASQFLVDHIREVQTFVVAVGLAITKTFSMMVSNLTAGFAAASAIIARGFSNIVSLFDSIAQRIGFKNIGEAAAAAVVVAINTILGLMNAVVAVVTGAVQLVDAAMQSLEPLVQPIIDLVVSVIAEIGQLFTEQGQVPLEGWQALAALLGGIYELIGTILSGVVGFIGGVAGLAGALITEIGDVFRGFANVFNGVLVAVSRAFTSWNTGAVTQTQAAGKEHQSVWIKVGDVIVGIFATLIKTIGVFVEGLGVAANAIVQLAGRAVEAFKGLGAVIEGGQALDPAKIKAGLDGLNHAFTDPLATTGAKQFTHDLGQIVDDSNWHIVSNAVKAGKEFKSAWDKTGRDVVAGFTTLNADTFNQASGLVAAQANQAGRDSADAYIQGLIEQWSQGAVAATAAAAAAKKQSDAQKAALAAAQQAAWANEQLNADRSPPEPTPKNRHHKKSPTELATEQIQGLLPQIATSKQLIDLAEAESISYQHMNGILAAQAALRKAGLRDASNHLILTYSQAQAQGGVAKKLVDTVVAATELQEQVKRIEEAMKQTAKNDEGIRNAQEQVALARDLTVSSGEYRAALAAQKALQQAGFQLTLQEAQAVDQYGNALHPIEKALADSAQAQERWNEAAKQTEQIANTLRGFQQSADDVDRYVTAMRQGITATAEMRAQIAAEHALMQAHNEEIFNSAWLTNQQDLALYNLTKTFSLVGGSADEFAKTLKQVSDDNLALHNPIAATRKKIQEESDAIAVQIKAWYDLKIAIAEVQLQAAAKSGDVGGVQAALKSIDDARKQQADALGTLHDNTTTNLARNSTGVMDSIKSNLELQLQAASNFGEQSKTIFNNAVGNMTDALTTFVMTGKLSFRQFADAVIADIARMIIKFLVLKAVQAIGNMFGLPFADGGVMTSSGSADLPPVPYANGGIMTGLGNVQLRKYASGGIAHSAHVAIFGEGSTPEAYVPLPDGRTIPVTIRNPSTQQTDNLTGSVATGVMAGMGPVSLALNALAAKLGPQGFTPPTSSGRSGNIELHSHVQINSSPGMGGGAGNMAADSKFADAISKKVHAELKDLVVETVLDQSRPGGTFNPMGSNRSRF